MTLCSMKNNKGEPCSNNAANGFFIDEMPVCKTHYGNHAVAKLQAEIDAKSPPKEPLPFIEPVFCKCKTKEGTKDEKPCQNTVKNDSKYEGMCPAHYNAYQKKLAKESAPPKEEVEREPCLQIIKDPKVGSKQCTKLSVEGCDGYCKRHFNLKNKIKNKSEKSEQNDTKKTELQILTEAVMAATAALAAAKAAAIKEEIEVESKSKPKVKRERKTKSKSDPPATESLDKSYKDIMQDLEGENSELLTKQLPILEGVDISKPISDNPYDDVEVPEEF